jgi:hypothetical protein
MLRDLSKSELALANYMSHLSGLAFDASWMEGLEFELWKGVKGEISEYGRLTFDPMVIERLSELSTAANGWIIFDDAREEILISFEEWEGMLKQ